MHCIDLTFALDCNWLASKLDSAKIVHIIDLVITWNRLF